MLGQALFFCLWHLIKIMHNFRVPSLGHLQKDIYQDVENVNSGQGRSERVRKWFLCPYIQVQVELGVLISMTAEYSLPD